MSRNQQIIILVLAILVSVGLVTGAYIKKHPNAFRSASDNTQAEAPATPVKNGKGQTGQHPTPRQPVYTPPVAQNAKPQPRVEKPTAQNYKGNGLYKDNPVVATNAAVRTVVGQMRLLSVSITGAILRGKIGYEHLEQLDFTPENADSGEDMSVFNPQGLVRFHPLLNKWIDQDLLDQVTSQPGQAIWYSLRRQQDSTAMIDVLYAIIPYPSAALCGATMQHFTLSSNLQLANDNGQVVPDSAGYFPKGVYKAPACLFTPDKKAFWVYPLRTRLLRPGSRSWQAAP